MNNAKRAQELATALHDLSALRRMSDPRNPQLLTTGLHTLHAAEEAWFDAPGIALCLGTAKQRLLHDMNQGVPPGDSLKVALAFIRKWLPRLPDEEKSMLDIADDPQTADVPRTAKGLERRIPNASRGPVQVRSAKARAVNQEFAKPSVEVLEKTLLALRQWQPPREGQ